MLAFLDPSKYPIAKELAFELMWNGVELQLYVSTTGKIVVRNAHKLSEKDKLSFKRVIEQADLIASSSYPQRLIEQMQSDMAKNKSPASLKTTDALSSLTQAGDDPYDRYWISSGSILPLSFAKSVPALNIGMITLAAFFLVPVLTENPIALYSVVAISCLAMISQLCSGLFERHMGPASNRLIQDGFSAITLSISSFSSARIVARIFLNRILELADQAQDAEANYISGSVALALASLAIVIAWFLPSVAVMGPRVQAAAVNIERQCLKLKDEKNAKIREQILDDYKRNEGASLAGRVLCKSNSLLKPSESYAEERMINPASLITIATRLGSAFVASAKFSLAFRINRGVPESILLPMAVMSLLHGYLNREIAFKLMNKTVGKLPAMSDSLPFMAASLKYSSEVCGVGFNSIINPSITFFFIFEKFLKLYGQGVEATSQFTGIDAGVLAAAVLINIPSLILDLSSRRLGIDRFEGWSASRLRYIVEEAKTLSLRKEMGAYLQLMIAHSANQEVKRVPVVAKKEQGRDLAL